MVKLYLFMAAFFSLVGIVIWVAFLRPVAQEVALGTIRGKSFREARTYQQSQPGISRGFRTPTEIPIPESEVFEIALDGQDETVAYSLGTAGAQRFSIGQRVRVKYVKRGLQPFWQRIYVRDMEPADATPP